MAKQVDLYSSYSNFNNKVLGAIRKETFGTDIGQNSWLTVDEYDRFLPLLNLAPDHHILEVASGSGGPAIYLARATGCRVTGIDADEGGVATATQMARAAGDDGRVSFRVANATEKLPFEADSFEALVCIDALNHFPHRLQVFLEWHRVLRPGARALFTDPVVITGPVTSEELALRSSIGVFLFVPPRVNEQLLQQSGLQLVLREDVSDIAATIARRWYEARQKFREDLIPIEGEERFDGLQRFFESVHRLTSEKRLSRMAYVAEKRG